MHGKTLIVSLVWILAFWQSVSGQEPKPASPQLEAMKKLHFLVGEWKGEGWTEFSPGQRRTSPINESVQPKLGGMVLLVEGLGKNKAPGKLEEVVTHHALGILSYDDKAKVYRLRSHLFTGQSTEAEATFTDEGFQWRFQPSPNMSI